MCHCGTITYGSVWQWGPDVFEVVRSAYTKITSLKAHRLLLSTTSFLMQHSFMEREKQEVRCVSFGSWQPKPADCSQEVTDCRQLLVAVAFSRLLVLWSCAVKQPSGKRAKYAAWEVMDKWLLEDVSTANCTHVYRGWARASCSWRPMRLRVCGCTLTSRL